MDLFHKIEGAVAIVRGANCVEKQVDVFHRGERVYIPTAGGFVRVVARAGGEGQPFNTAHPKVSVVAFEADGVTLKGGSEPRYAAPLAVAA